MEVVKMGRPYYPPADLPSFQKLMASIGAEEKERPLTLDEQLRAHYGDDWARRNPPAWTHESAPVAGQLFTVATADGPTFEAISLADHIRRVGYWQRKYDNLRACALLIAAALAVLALVGWMR